MTTLQLLRQRRRSGVALMMFATVMSGVQSPAAEFRITGRGDSLNSPFSYVERTKPTAGDVIVVSSQAANTTLNLLPSGTGVLDVMGLKMASNAAAGLTIQAADSSGTETLNIGSAGIDLRFANQNLTINKSRGAGTVAITVGAAQTWVAGNNRTLTVGADVTGAAPLTLETTVGGNGIITLGAVNLSGGAPLTIERRGTGNIAVNGTLGGTTVNATSFTNAGALDFGGVVNVGTFNLKNLFNTNTTFGNTVNTTAGLNVTMAGGGGTVRFNNTITGGPMTMTMTNGSAALFAGQLNASSVNILSGTTGAMTFSDTVNTPSFTFQSARAGTGTVDFQKAMNASVVNITRYAGGNVNFLETVNSATSITGDLTTGDYVFSKAVTSPTILLTNRGTGTSSFAENITAGTSFAYRHLAVTGTTTFTKNISAPTITVDTFSASNFLGLETGFTTFNLNNNGTGLATIGNVATAGIQGGASSVVNFRNTQTGTITVGGATGGAITGTGTAVNYTSQGITAAGGILNLNASNTHTGATTLTGGTVNLGYATTNTSKLSDTAALTLSRTILNIQGVASSGHTEIVGNTVIGAGASSVIRTGATGLLQMNALTRTIGGTVNFGAASIANTDLLNVGATGILGGWATVAANDWAMSGTTGTDVAVTAYTGYTTNVTPASWNVAGQNVTATSITAGSNLATGTINSLKLNVAAAATVPFALATSRLTLDSGGLLLIGAGTKTFGSVALPGEITAGTSAAQLAGAANPDVFFHVSGGDATIFSKIVNNGATAVGIVKTQAGKLIVVSDNVNTGATHISAGDLIIGNGSTTGSLGAGAVANHGKLVFNRSNSLTFANSVSGVGKVEQNNATSTLTLSGVNDYYGETTLRLGAINAGSTTGLSPNSTFVFENVASAILRLNGFNSTIGSLKDGSGVATTSSIELGANTLTFGGNHLATTTYSGVIKGTGNIVKEGVATATLAGANTFTGTATLNLGGLTFTGATALTGATVNQGVMTFSSAGGATIAGPVTVNNGSSIVMSGTTNTLTGPVVVNGGGLANFTSAAGTTNFASTVNLNGGGELSVTNLANFSGAVNVNDRAKLAFVSTGTGIHNFSGGLTVAESAILTLPTGANFGGTGLTLNNPGALTWSKIMTFNAPLTLNSAMALSLTEAVNGTTLGAVNLNSPNASLTVARLKPATPVGAITMAGNVLTLTAAVGTPITVASVNASKGTSTFNGTYSVTGNVAVTGTASINMVNGPTTIGGTFTTAGTGNVAMNGGTTVTGAASFANLGTLTLAGNNTFNSGVSFSTPGAVNLSGTTTVVGGLVVNSGVVSLLGQTGPGLTSITINGGSLALASPGGSTIPASVPVNLTAAGAGLVVSESQVLETVTSPLDSRIAVAAGRVLNLAVASSGTIDGVISGAGSLVKSGAGDLTLTGGNSFEGGLSINAGRVILATNPANPGSTSVLGDRLPVTIAAGSELSMSNRVETIGSIAGAGNVNIGSSGQLTIGGLGSSGVFSGQVLGGAGASLVKLGAGTTTLTGQNTFGDSLRVVEGGIVLDRLGGETLASTTNVELVQPGSTLTVNSNQVLGKLSSASGTNLSIAALTKVTATYVDSVPFLLPGFLTTASRVVTDISEPGTRDVTAGMFLQNTSGLDGQTWVVQVVGTGLNASPGLLLSSAATGTSSTTLRLVKVGLMAGNITGAGSFEKLGSGHLILAGNNTNTGETLVSAGTLMLGGLEVGGAYVTGNVLSDQSRLVFPAVGSATVAVADNASNFLSFERVGSLSGGNPNTVINLINGVTASQKNIGAFAFGGDNSSTTFNGSFLADEVPVGTDLADGLWGVR
jgi:fibronectin-binding autotransporter adhesin